MKSYSLNIPGDRAAIQLLRALAGDPLTCLAALHIAHPSPLGREQMQFMTGIKTALRITNAMRVLCDVYSYAARLTRFVGWCLTDKGAQLQLPGLATVLSNNPTRAANEGSFSTLVPSSSSGLYIESELDQALLKTTTTTANEDRNSTLVSKTPIPPEAQALMDDYLRGCPKNHMLKAVRTALARGDTLKDLEIDMLEWVMYGESPAGKGIHGAALHAASRIRDGDKCPSYFFRYSEDDPATGKLWRAWKNANRDWIQRLDELLERKPSFHF